MTDGPLIVQSDKTLLLEIDHELAQEARRAIAPFAELEKVVPGVIVSDTGVPPHTVAWVTPWPYSIDTPEFKFMLPANVFLIRRVAPNNNNKK